MFIAKSIEQFLNASGTECSSDSYEQVQMSIKMALRSPWNTEFRCFDTNSSGDLTNCTNLSMEVGYWCEETNVKIMESEGILASDHRSKTPEMWKLVLLSSQFISQGDLDGAFV